MKERRILAEGICLGGALLLATLGPVGLCSFKLNLNDAWAESSIEEVVVEEPTPEAAPEAAPTMDISRLASQLRLGMTYHEIVKLLGAPGERKEMEAKRSAVWEYGSHKIFFREGKVVAWTSVNAAPAQAEGSGIESPAGADNQHIQASGTKKDPPDEETIRSLLGEIMESSQGGGGRAPSAEGSSPEPEHAPEARVLDPGKQDQDRASLPPLIQQLSPY
jgi:hypothetical protein